VDRSAENFTLTAGADSYSGSRSIVSTVMSSSWPKMALPDGKRKGMERMYPLPSVASVLSD
jgi:hypothetical protein